MLQKLHQLEVLLSAPKDFFFEKGLAGYPDLPQDLLSANPYSYPEEVCLAITAVKQDFEALHQSDKDELLRRVASARQEPPVLDDNAVGSGWTGFLRDDRQCRATHAFQIKAYTPATDFKELELSVAKRRRIEGGVSLTTTVEFQDVCVPCPVCGVDQHPSNLQASHLLPCQGYRKFLQTKLKKLKNLEEHFAAIRSEIAKDEDVVRYLNIKDSEFLMSLRNMVPICAGQNGFINANLALKQKDGSWIWEDFAVIKRSWHLAKVPRQLEEQINDLYMAPYLNAHYKLMKIFAPYSSALAAAAGDDMPSGFDVGEFEQDVRYWHNVLHPAAPIKIEEWRQGICV
eukprot:TRINITY_DN3527_c0_g1_i2.p1 TRINITY_DN3527_c0_g1~~TRINITY_DN3527_c0_g1_i2.p1  ORF type:complete len:343 (+),score=50.47 TRINITY_DN3527_c0_g1_i2:47-1075(+)